VLREAGLLDALTPNELVSLRRPAYRFESEPDSEFRNGREIRAYTLELAEAIGAALDRGMFPLLIGGDCSVLLAGLLAARRRGRTGLLHVDGHSDFYHSGNHDQTRRPGSVAGMDLAIAVGLGSDILTHWDDVHEPLVDPHDVVQLGDRERDDPDYPFVDAPGYGITIVAIQRILRDGVAASWRRANDILLERQLERVWLHIDVDVLDQAVMPAVDSPGSPGLDLVQLAELATFALESGRIVGAEFTIYDPDLDPGRRYAGDLIRMIGEIFGRR
jgi:arginase